MRIILFSGLIGFLVNSILQRVTGIIPADDIVFPIVLIILMILLLALSIIDKGAK